MAQINDFGEILWGYLGDSLRNELKREKLAVYDWYHKTFVTWPTSIQVAVNAQRFAKKHGLSLSLDDPQGLVNLFFLKRFTLSQTTSSPGPNRQLTAFQRVAAIYAARTRTTLIADIEAVDRRAAALGAVDQVAGYPSVLVYRANERAFWEAQIRQILPPDVAVLDWNEVTPQSPKKSLWLVDYTQLERGFRFHSLNLRHRSIIIDQADLIKNPASRRSQNVEKLVEKLPYRFLLTNFPVNLSLTDLHELLRVLGKQEAFADFQTFLVTEPPDPLDTNASGFLWYRRQQKLEQLYQRLRATCLVRRGNDPGLQIQCQVENVKLTGLPEKFQLGEVKSCLRELGLQKAAGVIDWLWKFIPQTQGKVLIVAHHNDVVKALAAGLNIPAIYRKVGETERSQHWKDFLAPDGPRALVLSAKAALPDSLSGVTALVLVEFQFTPQQLSNLVGRILGADSQATLSIQHLAASESILDQNAVDRLELRLENIEIVLGRDKTGK